MGLKGHVGDPRKEAKGNKEKGNKLLLPPSASAEIRPMELTLAPSPISWSSVVKIFSIKYNEVFGSAGRKAYFDFNRSKSRVTDASHMDNVIDVRSPFRLQETL